MFPHKKIWNVQQNPWARQVHGEKRTLKIPHNCHCIWAELSSNNASFKECLSEGFHYFKGPIDRFIRALSLYSQIRALEILGIPPGVPLLHCHFLSSPCSRMVLEDPAHPATAAHTQATLPTDWVPPECWDCNMTNFVFLEWARIKRTTKSK